MRGRLALVTGGGTGLGRCISLGLAARGYDLIINYSRSKKEATETADECRAKGTKVTLVQADVSEPAGCRLLADAADAQHGKLDLLVNNAGVTRQARDLADLSLLNKDDFMDVYSVNVAGPFLALQALKPLLLNAHAQTDRASVVLNVSSVAGLTGVGSSLAYIASKGALNSMTIALARSLGPQIRVNALCPGFIGTRWFRDAMSEDKYAATVANVQARTALHVASGPDDIADVALFLCGDESRHVTGELIRVDGGMHLGEASLKK